MITQHRGRQGALRFVSALTLGAFAILGFAAPAMAVGPNIDPQAEGSITIHKYQSPAEDPELPNNGELIDPAPGLTPIDGVTFTITPISGADLTTNAGWDTAATWSADPSSVPAANLGTPVVTVTTADGGIAASGALGIGAYLVEETNAGDNGIVIGSAPFVVTIPLPTTIDEEQVWLTDVHVYPKNSVSDVTKTVDDTEAYTLGDVVNWNISATIPATVGTEPVTSFFLTDSIDPRLTVASTSGSFIPSGGGATIPLVAGTDFDVTSTNQKANGGGGNHKIELLGAGLDQLPGLAEGHFVVEVGTTVTSIGDGTIVNSAFVNINGSELQSEPAETKWGAVEIFKFEDDTDPQLSLEGAVFQVFTTQTGDTPLSVLVGEVSQTDFTTGADGKVVVPGLKAGETYWLEEITAPTRYQQLTERVEVSGLSAENTLQLPLVVEVPNIKVPDWELPLTGGAGMLLPMMGLGLLAVSAGTATMLSKRGKKTL